MSERTKVLSLSFARWTLGVVGLVHGLANTFGLFGGPGLSQYVTEMSGRVSVAAELTGYVVAIGQLVGGAALLLGPMAKVAAWMFLLFLVGDVLLGARYHSFFVANRGVEYPLALAALCAIVAAHGPGAFAIEVRTRKAEK